MPATNVRTALAQGREAQQQRSWWGILKKSASEWSDADAMTWAAAIACYTVLALAPLLVVAVKVATVVLRGQATAVSTIHDDVAKMMGGDGANAITAILDKIVNQKGGVLATIVSSVLVIVSVGGVFAEVQQAMNRVWKLKPKPGQAMMAFIRARLKSVVVLGLAAVVLVASLWVAAWLDRLTASFGAGGKILAWATDLVATLIALSLIFAMVFRTVPDAEIGWSTTVIGAVITAVLFGVGKYGLALYFKFGTPTSAFGALGSLAAILIWIYYSAQIVLFGAVFTQVYAKQRGHGVEPSKHAEFLSECDETETATPSPEKPGSKPARASSKGAGQRQDGGYTAVLGQHVASYPGASRYTDGGAPRQPATRNLIVAGAGIALGALIGGLGALEIRQRQTGVDPKRLAARRLDQRMDRVREKVAHASRMKRYLEQDDINQQLDELNARIKASGLRRRPAMRPVLRTRWPDRVLAAVKGFF